MRAVSEELVEAVAVEVHRVLWPTLLPSARGYPKHTWEKSEALARAAIGVTLDAAREELENGLDAHEGRWLDRAAVLAALESLGGEER